MEYTVRESQQEDYIAILSLLKKAKLTTDNQLSEEVFKSMLERNKGFFLVAETEGNVIGSIFATHDGGYVGYIYKIVVAKEHQRKAVASKLLTEAMKRLKEEKLHFVFVRISRANRASRAFFKAHGFHSIDGKMMDKVF